MVTEPAPEFQELEHEVNQLIHVFQEVCDTNESLKSELQTMKERKSDEHMDTVTREIIRNKVQLMLDILEDM